MYCLGLFLLFLQEVQCLQYDVARLASEPHMSANFHGLVLLESKKEKEKMKNFGTYRKICIFYLTPFPCSYLHDILVSGVI